jgi:tetratricopeptide (TPR) repeat protein
MTSGQDDDRDTPSPSSSYANSSDIESIDSRDVYQDATGNSDIADEFPEEFDDRLRVAEDEDSFGDRDNNNNPGAGLHSGGANELAATHEETEYTDRDEEDSTLESTRHRSSKVFEEKDCLPGASGMSEEERMEHICQAVRLKEEGNSLFSKGDYDGARNVYGEGLAHCPVHQKESAMLFSNLAACDMKQSLWENAILHCDQAIAMDPNYTKAYYRRATAYEQSNKSTDLSKALEGR